MKQLKLHAVMALLLTPLFALVLSNDLLWSIVGLVYIAVLFRVSHTPAGKQFIREYYREIIRLEHML